MSNRKDRIGIPIENLGGFHAEAQDQSNLPVHRNCLHEYGKPEIIGHTIHGNGPECVLVLHDWMGDSKNYDSLIPYLDFTQYTYLFADLRGYGKSRHFTGKFNMAEVKADLFSLTSHLNWKRYHLVGHSMTGMVVQVMAMDDALNGSQRIKSVVVINPLTAHDQPLNESGRTGHAEAVCNVKSKESMALFADQRFDGTWQSPKTTHHLKLSSEEAVKAYYRLWLETDSISIKYNDIKAPFLIIVGKKVLSESQETLLRQTFANRYERTLFSFIHDAGHYPMLETPVLLASLIEGFLERNFLTN